MGNRLVAAAEQQAHPPEFAMPSDDQLDNLIIQRFIPRQRGIWRVFSREVEAAEDASNPECDL